MATFGSYQEYDPVLAMIADAQRFKLKLNAHKGNLGDLPGDVLLTKLKEEVAELEEAIQRGSAFDAVLEIADIGNFAMGIAIAMLRQKGGLIRAKSEEPANV